MTFTLGNSEGMRSGTYSVHTHHRSSISELQPAADGK
jgi:hypothetical protein